MGVGAEIVFVSHDWGTALTFGRATCNGDVIKGFAPNERTVQSIASCEDWPENVRFAVARRLR